MVRQAGVVAGAAAVAGKPVQSPLRIKSDVFMKCLTVDLLEELCLSQPAQSLLRLVSHFWP